MPNEIISSDYIYDTDGTNIHDERVKCFRNKYTGHEIQIPYEDNSLDEHDERIRADERERVLSEITKDDCPVDSIPAKLYADGFNDGYRRRVRNGRDNTRFDL